MPEEYPASERVPPRLPIDLIGLILGPLALLSWLFLADPGNLSPEAFRLTGILLLTVIWWITEPIPIPVTGLLAVALCVMLGAVPAIANEKPVETALKPFADDSAFFLLGGLFIGRAMSRHGLDRRFALSILCTPWASRSPGMLLFAVGLAVALVSMAVSNTAATAMIYPVTMGIIAELAMGQGDEGAFRRSPYASTLLLMTAYASSVGGVGTPIGTGTNVLAISMFQNEFEMTIDFFHWIVIGLPLSIILLGGLNFWLRLTSPAPRLDFPALRAYLQKQRNELGPWNRGEINTLIAFLIVVALWMTPGVLGLITPDLSRDFSRRFPAGATALLAPVLLFLMPVRWRERRFTLAPIDILKIDWNTFLMFGSGLALGTLMSQTGLAKHIADGVLNVVSDPGLWTVTAMAIAGGIILSEFTSNAATASALLPVVNGICIQKGLDPIPPLMGLTFGASFGSALPVATPPNAIVYGSGLVPVRRMVLAGLGLDVISGIVIWLVLRLAWTLGWSPLIK